MNAYIEILRPFNGLMAAVAVVLGAIVAGANGTDIAIAALSAFLISGAGMVVNDYFDVKIDKINRPQRPIPSGRITKRNAAIYSGALFGAGVGLTFALNPLTFVLATLNTLVELVYAWKFKKMPLIGNIAVSWLVGSTYLYGGLLTGSLAGPVLLGIVAFLANLAREVYKTVTDYTGDKKERARTIAIVWGRRKAKLLGDLFALLASGISVMLYIYGILGVVYLVIQLVAVAVYLSSIFVPAKEAEKRTKLGMFIGLVAIAADLISRTI